MKLSVTQHIPNAITCTSLFLGCMAIVAALGFDETIFGIEGYKLAYILIAFAAICDFCDGAAARMLHAYSALGKELDSLSDLVSFGVAPGMLVYSMLSHTAGCPQWLPFIAFYIPVAGELRLARFNIDNRQSTSFLGMPIPANAIFWIGYTDFAIKNGEISPWISAALVIIVASLMLTSVLKMFSLKFKNASVADNYMRYIIIATAIISVALAGLSGLALTIAVYVILSAIPTKGGKG
ncbi:CDP-diacylglycerol--serine O-phosphatidyltransferase [Muribaculum caecicola]|uniref:CDP-diacylglycerol--serine O-phosphatidyltransferase n=1 Tax=Muribaculum caecicola TaxID=3038144 RepID=A0AC61S4L0_9BACT|nr:CDP-diacylglycerol--serine O-phosphatidyltransferase [Muribaculum caecicola]THG46826.1 CDP-diacylglycerol--serine O-phosphatidyltransferase [Muribaculum caecicola]